MNGFFFAFAVSPCSLWFATSNGKINKLFLAFSKCKSFRRDESTYMQNFEVFFYACLSSFSIPFQIVPKNSTEILTRIIHITQHQFAIKSHLLTVYGICKITIEWKVSSSLDCYCLNAKKREEYPYDRTKTINWNGNKSDNENNR